MIDMAVSNEEKNLKRQKKREKQEAIERTTNRYMINLMWGIVGILVLRLVEKGYNSLATILQMPTIMKIVAGVFAVIAVALFVLGKVKVIKNTKRCYDYAVFTAVIAVVSLWIGFYAKIRLFVINFLPYFKPFDSRFWYSWLPMAAIIVYLVVALIWTIVKLAKIEKDKKFKA